MIKYILKDITTVKKGIVAHGVNCQRKMNSGVARAIRNKWPEVYETFMLYPGDSMLGNSALIKINDSPLYVVNCYTQRYYGKDGKRYADPSAIYSSLIMSCETARNEKLDLYMPKIGCGFGGLSWKDDVEPIIIEKSDLYDINIIVCDL